MTQTDNATCRKMLFTSTRHISERTISLLRATDPYDWPHGGGPIGKSGFFYRSMKRNGSYLPTDLFEVLSWAADNEYDSVTFSSTGPVIEQFEVYREPGSYGDGLVWAKSPRHLKYQRSLYDSALSALSVGERAFEVSPENVASALTAALEAVDQYLTEHEDEGLWNFPLPSLQRIADVATVYLGERNYKTGTWDESISAAAQLHRLLNLELEQSRNLQLDPQQRLIRSLAEQIRFFLQEPE
ncbi:hypothetical protein N183_14815 [Sinorhizobium sp. Sb3]|uniref:DUF5983 family protein n=1 Tax=Sinorhizobium sp. Sb3 TaxID=1358417 RepID=UPI00071C9D3D|nr:hypothetical protein [Sinorhizobium sp. Sb3]KSV81782.1 hypothetical protein N183_14815 [Sinorhizobium sp. Sb3]